MQEISSINPERLHHAYIIVGDREKIRSAIFDFLEESLEISTNANPDLSILEFNTFSIADARLLAETQQRKAFGETAEGKAARKFFIISLNAITDEAQNALLKVFEEPTPGTHFFIIAAQNNFLPTFLSRVNLIKTEREAKKSDLLSLSLPERLKEVAGLAADINDEKKTRQDAIDLVTEIEATLATNIEKNAQALAACAFARQALMNRGSMTKMILENLILNL